MSHFFCVSRLTIILLFFFYPFSTFAIENFQDLVIKIDEFLQETRKNDGKNKSDNDIDNSDNLNDLNAWGSQIQNRIYENLRYPHLAVVEEIGGKVTIQLKVTKEGKLEKLKILNSSGFSILDEEALRATEQAHGFPSAPISLNRSAYSFSLPIKFELGSQNKGDFQPNKHTKKKIDQKSSEISTMEELKLRKNINQLIGRYWNKALLIGGADFENYAVKVEILLDSNGNIVGEIRPVEPVIPTGRYAIAFREASNAIKAVGRIPMPPEKYKNGLKLRLTFDPTSGIGFDQMALENLAESDPDKKITPEIENFVTTYYEFSGTFTTNLRNSTKLLQVGIGVSTQYDDTVMANVEMHQLSLRSEILGMMSEFSEEEIQGKAGRNALSAAVAEAINKKLIELEDFGGVESVHFTSFMLR